MMSDKQRKERLLGIGGSDVGIIFGLSSYKTPYQLFLEKTGCLTFEESETPFQEWGHRLEPAIRDKFSEDHDVQVSEVNTVTHPMYPFLRANLDGFIPKWNAVLEIKCANSFSKDQWGESGTDKMPLPYLLQVAHYVACTNAKEAHVAVLLGGNEYRELIYKRDRELEEIMIDKVRHFWEGVTKNTPPPPVRPIDLQLLYGKGMAEKSIEGDKNGVQFVTEWRDTKDQLAKMIQKEKECKFKVMEYMGEAEYLLDSEGKKLVSWKADKKGCRKLLLKN